MEAKETVMATIHLNDGDKAFIEEQVKAGHYEDADAVLHAGLRLLRSQKAKLTELRAMIGEADRQIENGEYVSFSSTDDLTDYIVKKAMARK